MNNAQIAIVLADTLLPAAFVLFVVATTRMPGTSEYRDGLSVAIERLQQKWHAAEKPRQP
jgi:hypothetical protein